MKALILIALALPAQAADTSACQYWLDRLGEIAMYERMKEEAPRIAREEGPLSAQDYLDDLGRRIRAIQAAINEELGGAR